jgi:hypothetical protein
MSLNFSLIKKREILRILALTILLAFVLTLGYGINLNLLFTIPPLFFFSLYVPLVIIKNKAKGEIEYEFILWQNKKFAGEIDLTKLFDLKSFPTWLFFSLFFSSLTLFKFPIILIGKINYEGRKNKMKEVSDKNSEIKVVKKHFLLFYIIILSIGFLLLLLEPLLAIIPFLISLSLLIPFPGNLGYELFVLDVKYWISAVKLTLLSLLFYFFYILSYGLKISISSL